MTTYRFNGYTGRARHVFTCEVCSKPNRTKTFTREHTVIPFNKNADGSIKQARQVQQEAQAAAVAERAEFAKHPVCASCWDAMSYAEKQTISALRKAGA
jgi:hypothetical protein